MNSNSKYPSVVFTSYFDLLKYTHGVYKEDQTAKADRTKVGRLSVYGACLNIDLSSGILPVETTRRVNPYIAIGEMLWIMSGSQYTHTLHKFGGGRIWDKWADSNGDIGPLYGAILRGVHNKQDQLVQFIEKLVTNPTSSRILMSTWDPSFLPTTESAKPKDNVSEGKGALAPCHGVAIQAFVDIDKEGNKTLSLSMYQRSADLPVGVVFNVIQYAFLTHLLAKLTGMKPGMLMMRFGDAHIYSDQYHLVEEQVQRTPTEYPKFDFTPMGYVIINNHIPFNSVKDNSDKTVINIKRFLDFLYDINISAGALVDVIDYNPQNPIAYPVAE